MLRSQKVDLVSFHFFSHCLFYFIFDLFSIFLFLELKVRISDNIT